MFLQITKAGIWILYIKYSFRQKTKLGSLEKFPVLTSFPILAVLHTKGNTHAFSFEQTVLDQV